MTGVGLLAVDARGRWAAPPLKVIMMTGLIPNDWHNVHNRDKIDVIPSVKVSEFRGKQSRLYDKKSTLHVRHCIPKTDRYSQG